MAFAIYVKEGLPFARDLSQENSQDSYLYFRQALLRSVYFISLTSVDHLPRLYA